MRVRASHLLTRTPQRNSGGTLPPSLAHHSRMHKLQNFVLFHASNSSTLSLLMRDACLRSPGPTSSEFASGARRTEDDCDGRHAWLGQVYAREAARRSWLGSREPRRDEDSKSASSSRIIVFVGRGSDVHVCVRVIVGPYRSSLLYVVCVTALPHVLRSRRAKLPLKTRCERARAWWSTAATSTTSSATSGFRWQPSSMSRESTRYILVKEVPFSSLSSSIHFCTQMYQ